MVSFVDEELCWWIWLTIPSPPSSWMCLSYVTMITGLVGFGLVGENWMNCEVWLCSWWRTAMNSCCCSLCSAVVEMCRWMWLLQLYLAICSSFYCYHGLTHRHGFTWWLSLWCVVVEHAMLLVSCVCAWGGNLNHPWISSGWLVLIYPIGIIFY